jgi:hypothetical protein
MLRRRRKRLVLHIGFHASGSSTIHQSLAGNREVLARHGVLYPEALTDHPSHLDLATALGFNPELLPADLEPEAVIDHYAERIDATRRGATIILASDEFCLGNHRPEAMDALRRFVDKLDVELQVAATVRDPQRFLLAVYLRELRETESQVDFGEWSEHHDLAGADFDGRLAVWDDLVGPTAEVEILPFDERRGADGGTLAALLDVAGLSPGTVSPAPSGDVDLDPRLAGALIALRRGIADPDQRRQGLATLLEVSGLMEPPGEPVAAVLDAGAREDLQVRIDAIGHRAGPPPI